MVTIEASSMHHMVLSNGHVRFKPYAWIWEISGKGTKNRKLTKSLTSSGGFFQVPNGDRGYWRWQRQRCYKVRDRQSRSKVLPFLTGISCITRCNFPWRNFCDSILPYSCWGDLRIWETEKKRRLHASKTSIHDKSFSGCGTLALDTNPNKGHIVTVGADNLGHIWRLNESGELEKNI